MGIITKKAYLWMIIKYDLVVSTQFNFRNTSKCKLIEEMGDQNEERTVDYTTL